MQCSFNQPPWGHQDLYVCSDAVLTVLFLQYLYYITCIIIIFCRYTFFIVLYPIGVTGELLTVINGLDEAKRTQIYSYSLPNALNVSFNFYYFLIFFMLSYIPVFPQLYTHMLAQRKKIISGDRPKTD